MIAISGTVSDYSSDSITEIIFELHKKKDTVYTGLNIAVSVPDKKANPLIVEVTLGNASSELKQTGLNLKAGDLIDIHVTQPNVVNANVGPDRICKSRCRMQ